MAESLEQAKVSSDESAEVVSEVSGTNKKRKHVGESEAVLNDRPRRQARPVVPYGSQASETKLRIKPPVNIVQGKGIPLGQIPSVARAIDKHKTSDETLKNIHRLFYGRAGTKNDIKSHLRAFSGLNPESPVDATVIKEKLEKLKMIALKKMCAFFNIKRSIFESKEENKSATRTQIDKQLLSTWNNMSEKDREPYFARAKNAKNKGTLTAKKTETPKKSSETPDSDDDDDKKPKKRVRVAKKGSTKTVKSKFKSPETIESEDDKSEDPEDDNVERDPVHDSADMQLDDDVIDEKQADENPNKEGDNNKSDSDELSDVPDETDSEKEPPYKKTKKNAEN
ncbi:21536_t:CDS:2 [Cetraspora pellucida]|uniref:21536_t:CDS:1 n=1 Tax=Cetraspora pellucida TaxID=1433469 RepID=A0A9N8ZT09_9GLOM|nr:21536_t:CDS:2 [Cetraspora pellucida]